MRTKLVDCKLPEVNTQDMPENVNMRCTCQGNAGYKHTFKETLAKCFWTIQLPLKCFKVNK
jgi:hypothetical protein